MSKIVGGIIAFSNRLLRIIEIYYSPQSKKARLRIKAIQYADIFIDNFLQNNPRLVKKSKKLAILYAKKYKLLRKRFR